MRRSRPAAVAIAALICISASASGVQADPRPPHMRPDPQSDEAGLWFASDRAEADAKGSAELDADPALNAYVRGVECKVAPEYCDELRVYVMDRPFFNAEAAPNGYVEVWSGLLLRADDEAELAFVLGHETTHYAERHSLAAIEAAKVRGDVAVALEIGIGAAGFAFAAGSGSAAIANNIMNATGELINIVYLANIARFFAFSREQESEADRLGFARAVRAGYNPQAATDIWRALMAETAHSDFGKVRDAETRASIFATHPLTDVRIAALQALAAKAPPGGDFGRERYRAAIRPHLPALLRDDLRRRDYGESLFIIERLIGEGEDLGVLNFYKGEAYRLRRGPGDLVLAVTAYQAAAAAADAPAATWRTLGDLYVQTADPARAREAYQTYLARAPDAQDRWIVESSLKKLGQGT